MLLIPSYENSAIPVAQHALPAEKIALDLTRASQSYTRSDELASPLSPLEAARRNAIAIGSRNDLASPALLDSSDSKTKGV